MSIIDILLYRMKRDILKKVKYNNHKINTKYTYTNNSISISASWCPCLMKSDSCVALPVKWGLPARPKQIAHMIEDLPLPFKPTIRFNPFLG